MLGCKLYPSFEVRIRFVLGKPDFVGEVAQVIPPHKILKGSFFCPFVVIKVNKCTLFNTSYKPLLKQITLTY